MGRDHFTSCVRPREKVKRKSSRYYDQWKCASPSWKAWRETDQSTASMVLVDSFNIRRKSKMIRKPSTRFPDQNSLKWPWYWIMKVEKFRTSFRKFTASNINQAHQKQQGRQETKAKLKRGDKHGKNDLPLFSDQAVACKTNRKIVMARFTGKPTYSTEAVFRLLWRFVHLFTAIKKWSRKKYRDILSEARGFFYHNSTVLW